MVEAVEHPYARRHFAEGHDEPIAAGRDADLFEA
jgi:hypothetical protein